MAVQVSDQADPVASDVNVERVHLVNLCARWTGDRHAAEDVTQETLAEAWLHQNELRDPTRRWQWLAGSRAIDSCTGGADTGATPLAQLLRRVAPCLS